MISPDPVSPKIAEAPAIKAPASPVLDAQSYAEEIRARRGDISMMESKLAVNMETPPGWTRRWCNDDGDNIPRRLQDGWRFVPKQGVKAKGDVDVGDRITVVSSMGDGKPMNIYLMEIPTEIAEEILEARSGAQVRRFEDTVRRGVVGTGGPHVYRPQDNPHSSLHGAVTNSIGRPS